MMPLDQNPFFEKYLQAIDFIAADNQQKAAEERADQRYNERLNEQRAYSEEQQTKAADQQEFNSLLDYVDTYKANAKKGSPPTEDEFGQIKIASERLHELAKSGNVRMLKNQPEKFEEKEVKQSKETAFLGGETAKFYNYDPLQPVSPETKRVLEQSYKNYHKPPDKSGAGKDISNPLVLAQDLNKRAQSVFDKGVKDNGEEWATGVGTKLLSDYQSDIQQVLLDYNSGKIKEPEARMKLLALGNFEQFLEAFGDADKNDGDTESKILKALEKIK